MTQDASNVIRLRVREASQLFNTFDPFPFREKDLSPAVDQYITDWAEDLARHEPVQIAVDIQSGAGEKHAAADISDAIATWYVEKEKAEANAIRTLLRDGRRALLIGLALQAACLFVAWRLSQNYNGPFTYLMQESFVIIGWVVIWRPIEIFLYDWIPLVRRRKLYRRLATANVTVHTGHGTMAPSS